MPDEPARPPTTARRGNVQPGGRFGTAPEDERHVVPEVAPLGIDDAEMNVPEAVPGALPENERAARDAEDEQRK